MPDDKPIKANEKSTELDSNTQVVELSDQAKEVGVYYEAIKSHLQSPLRRDITTISTLPAPNSKWTWKLPDLDKNVALAMPNDSASTL